jgi:hypothetical protein
MGLILFAGIVRGYARIGVHKSSQCISLRPTMFRATCDNSVTTSAARQPTNSKPAHLEMPAGQTRFAPNQSAPTLCTAHHRTPAAHGTSLRQPSIRTPTPCGTGRALALRQLGTLELAALNISAHSAARLGPTDSPPLTPTCRRSRPAPPTQHAHQPSPMPADDADQNRVIVVRPGQPSAGLASHRPNVDPHWPFNHIETADFHLDR